MLKERLAVAKSVTRDLYAAEDAVDGTVDALTNLLSSMTDGRRKANLSAIYGAGAVDAVTKALAQIGKVRRSLVEAHVDLATTQRDLGLKAYAMGPWQEKPKGQRELGYVTDNGEMTDKKTSITA
jgi:succinylglutamate desuccinylase